MYQAKNSFSKKSVVVTGAGAGMGRKITEDFISQGATVIAVDIKEEALMKSKEEIEKKYSKDCLNLYVPFAGDISKQEVNAQAIEKAVEITGKIDILINNAGVAGRSEPITETADSEWDRILSVNLSGAMYAMRAAVNQMLKQKSGGNIVTVASLAGIRGCRSSAAYGAAKHGLIGLCENTAYMFMHKNIRSNIVCPGAIRTGMTSHPELENEFGRERIKSGMDSNMVYGEPEDVSNAVLFLASDDAKFINGATLVVDGGISCN